MLQYFLKMSAGIHPDDDIRANDLRIVRADCLDDAKARAQEVIEEWVNTVEWGGDWGEVGYVNLLYARWTLHCDNPLGPPVAQWEGTIEIND